MSFIPFSALACPLDGNPLDRRGQTWRCDAGHSFDVARQGHLHLLPVQHKRSRDPGDSKEMVAARQRFLNAGHYQPVADAVSRVVLANRPASATLHCLDAGCGEGHYLRQLADANPQGASLSLLGLDISKWAVLSAARQDSGADKPARCRWVVGSNANLPVLSGTLDRVLCLFGFPVHAEFARVLRPGGLLVLADAGPDHLRELRDIIYPSVKVQRERATPAPEGFCRAGSESVRYTLALDDAPSIADLLAMTPHLYRASAEGRTRADALEALSVTVDVRLTCFTRLEPPTS